MMLGEREFMKCTGMVMMEEEVNSLEGVSIGGVVNGAIEANSGIPVEGKVLHLEFRVEVFGVFPVAGMVVEGLLGLVLNLFGG